MLYIIVLRLHFFIANRLYSDIAINFYEQLFMNLHLN